jgi:hypothetical protein
VSLHQVQLRKDGPIHAAEYVRKVYLKRTLCGMLVGLAMPKQRLFKDQPGSCGRCRISYQRR